MQATRFIIGNRRGGKIARLLAVLAIPSILIWAQPKHVSKAQALEAAVVKVKPAYPATAKQLNIEGGVELEATVNENGDVDQVNILSGNPVLTRPAVDALKKWKFKPFTEGGKPVPAVAPVQFHFRKDM